MTNYQAIPATTSKRLIRARPLRDKLGGISEMTLWRRIKSGLVPPPIKIAGKNHWIESDIDALIDEAAAQAERTQ